MIRPRRMKRLKLTVLSRDVDGVIEYLGRHGVMQLCEEGESGNSSGALNGSSGGLTRYHSLLDRLQSCASYLSIELPSSGDQNTRLPSPADKDLAEQIISDIEKTRLKENDLYMEKLKVEEALSEAKAFENLKAPFSELDQLSYLTLRIGRLDPKKQGDIVASLGDRAIIVPLGEGDRILAASSRKGRFALDTELKKASFIPISIPEGFTGIPGELLSGLRDRMTGVEAKLGEAKEIKTDKAAEYGPALRRLTASYFMAVTVENLKSHLQSTRQAYVLDGWVPAAEVPRVVSDLERITDGRLAALACDPEELEEVAEGREKVPVSLDHGPFVRGFEGVVFSYGAPLYGTIDPTPFVALSFALLFGIMFGDLGQGFVLLILGFLTGKRGLAFLSGFRRFSVPLKAVGISSMVVGLLDGEVFATENLLIRPTRAITGFLTGVPVDKILHFMPEKGSLDKLFAFFAFTLAIGVLINSLGLVINILNQISLKRYEKAFFSKTGLAGALLFWYAIFLAVRIVLSGNPAWYDALGLGIPAGMIFFGPAFWRIISVQRPVLEHGLMVFIMEGLVELLESASSYVSNTVSFLRVGAFALSHAVLSFIVFTLSELVGSYGLGGPLFSFIVLVIGNGIIILLEGMIVAIQVVRLQYYEFFSKFFTETGVEFSPFRFQREVE